MRVLLIVMIGLLFTREAIAIKTLQTEKFPLTIYSTNILKKVEHFYPEFPVNTHKVTTFYTKNSQNRNKIVEQTFRFGVIGESFSVNIKQNINRVEYEFDYGTGYIGGGGYFKVTEGSVKKVESSCGKDICIDEVYVNGKLIKSEEVIVSPFILDKKDEQKYLSLEKRINQLYNLAISNKPRYAVHHVKNKETLELITQIPRQPVNYSSKITKRSIVYYTYKKKIKVITITASTNDHRISSATIYLNDSIPIYIFQAQKERMKVINSDAKSYELSSGFIVDRGEYEEITDKNKQKYVIYQYSKNRLFYDDKGVLFKMVDGGSVRYRGWAFDRMNKRFKNILKELLIAIKKDHDIQIKTKT